MESNMNLLITYMPYLILGIGIGYLVSLGVTGGPTILDYRKHDLENMKQRYRMLANKKKSS